MNYRNMRVADIAQLDGVKDLKPSVKAKFCKALKCEDAGDVVGAEQALNEAVALESA